MSSGKTCTDYNNNGHIIHITGFQFQGGNIHLQLLRLIAKEYIQQQFYWFLSIPNGNGIQTNNCETLYAVVTKFRTNFIFKEN